MGVGKKKYIMKKNYITPKTDLIHIIGDKAILVVSPGGGSFIPQAPPSGYDPGSGNAPR